MKINKSEAIALYKSAIAALYGVTVGAVCHTLRRAGIDQQQLPVRDYAQAIELYQAGCTASEIAKIQGRAVSTVANYFSEHGIKQNTLKDTRAALNLAADRLGCSADDLLQEARDND